MKKPKNALRLSIPEQGVEETFASGDELADFFDREVGFFNSEQAFANFQFRIANFQLNEIRVRPKAIAALSDLSKRIRGGEFHPHLENYVERARDLRLCDLRSDRYEARE